MRRPEPPYRAPDLQDETNEAEDPSEPLYVPDPDVVGRGPYKLKRVGRNLVYEDTTFTATILPDGTLKVRDRGSKAGYESANCASLVLTADLTDAVMRAKGIDPYAFEKRRFARHTAAMRSAMRRRHLHRAGQLALAELPFRLARLWRRHRGRPARLKRLLFDLWDECAERRGKRDRRREARLGVRARTIIVRFVNAKLPRGTTLAYQQAELRRLNNARQSRARFVPYRR